MNTTDYLDRNIHTLRMKAPANTSFGISTIQRLCNIGYNQAARTVERFIELGGLIQDETSSSQYRLSESSVMTGTQYRIYADNTVVHEDDFDNVDLSASMFDDFTTITVPDVVVDFIAESFTCSRPITEPARTRNKKV